jgi:hypothetical protein
VFDRGSRVRNVALSRCYVFSSYEQVLGSEGLWDRVRAQIRAPWPPVLGRPPAFRMVPSPHAEGRRRRGHASIRQRPPAGPEFCRPRYPEDCDTVGLTRRERK